MFFYKRYGRGHFGATFLSTIGGLFGLLALYFAIYLIKGGYEKASDLVFIAVGIAGFFGFRKLADVVYERKLKRMQQK